MKRIILTLLSLAISLTFAQPADLTPLLTLETEADELPSAWGGTRNETLSLDKGNAYAGEAALKIKRDEESPDSFSTASLNLPIDFSGESIELSGYLRTEEVEGFAGLWLRQDGESGTLEIDNMAAQDLNGTTPWTQYSVRLPLNPEARTIYFGVLLSGEGTTWADDLELLVDGKPLSEAPERVFETTVLDTDTEFGGGSNVDVSTLSDVQVTNLALLAKVWGFLKYHHPRVATGELHWDYELFRVLPDVLEANSPEASTDVLSSWINKLGVPTSCRPCAELPEDIHLLPNLDWLSDTQTLGGELSEQLETIYENRFARGEQFYVDLAQGAGNPVFEHEPAYETQQPPDTGYRLLALFRFWNIIEYWFPYRDLISEDWDEVLAASLPSFVEAQTWDAYRLELLALIAQVEDTHANLWSDLDARPPGGECRLDVSVRYIEDKFVVTQTDAEDADPAGLELGDVIVSVDGELVEDLVEAWRPYYAASNEPTRLRDMAQALPSGACGATELEVERGGETRTLTLERTSGNEPQGTHDRPGDTFQLLSPDVAYLKLSSVSQSDVNDYLEQAKDTKGLIIDIRNYPSDFMVFALGNHFVTEETPFAMFTAGDLSNPGAFVWGAEITLEPAKPHYDGEIVVLVDEVSQSQSEYTAMAFRSAPRTTVVGSTTAGADGNISPFALPGGAGTVISGLGVFYPDKTPTQQVGIIPDIVAKPTVSGIREGRDEVLEAALEVILPDADAETIRELAK